MKSSEPEPAVFEGQWSSGKAASAEPVTVHFETDGLSVKAGEGRVLAFWTYRGLIPGGPISKRGADLLLRSVETPRAALFIRGSGAAQLLMAKAPHIAQSAQRFRVVGLSLIATLIVSAAAAILFFGNFSASKSIAGLIPQKMASRMGASSVQMFGPIAPACVGQPGNAALQRILDRLQSGGDYGPPFTLHIALSKIPNAFALSGRHIVLLSALVKQAQSPEEVAGVLAHEMGHGLERDPEALFVRSTGMQALVQLLTGQSGTQAPLAAGALLLQLRYSRAAERSADAHAVEILRNAQIGPKPTAAFFIRNGGEAAGQKNAFDYLSTHPSSKERAALFLAQPAYPVRPVLGEKEWTDARAICGNNAAKPAEERAKPPKPPKGVTEL